VHCTFTEEHYRQIMVSFLEAGYRFIGFAEADPSAERRVILRHDVDLSIDDALRIARIDSGLGIASCFHFLITAEIYNLSSRAGQAAIAEIRSLGHTVGLHLDPVAIADGDMDSPDFYMRLGKLFELASLIIGKLDSYSIHRPASVGKLDNLLPERLGFPVPCFADADRYRRDMQFMSDSRRQWRQGCVCNRIDALAGRSLQLVLHPIWWPQEACTREASLEKLVRSNQTADQYLASNLSFYNRILK